MYPCTSSPSPTATPLPPSSSAKASARAQRLSNTPSPISPLGPPLRSSPSAVFSKANLSSPPPSRTHPLSYPLLPAQPRRRHDRRPHPRTFLQTRYLPRPSSRHRFLLAGFPARSGSRRRGNPALSRHGLAAPAPAENRKRSRQTPSFPGLTDPLRRQLHLL